MCAFVSSAPFLPLPSFPLFFVVHLAILWAILRAGSDIETKLTTISHLHKLVRRSMQHTLCKAESLFVILFKTRDLIFATLLPIGVLTVPQTKDPLFWSCGGGIFSFGELAVLTLRFRSCDDTYSRKFTIVGQWWVRVSHRTGEAAWRRCSWWVFIFELILMDCFHSNFIRQKHSHSHLEKTFQRWRKAAEFDPKYVLSKDTSGIKDNISLHEYIIIVNKSVLEISLLPHRFLV